MKKLLLLSLGLLGLAGLAGATPIGCSVLLAPNSSTILIASSCTVTPDAGFYISSLTLTATDDYTGYQSGNPVVSFAGTLSQTAAVYTTPTFCNVTTSGTNSVSCSVGINPSSTVTGLNLSSYTVGFATASNTVTGGTVTGSSIGLFLDYAETLIPSNGVPEPATLGLMGSALVGLGFLARKKK